MMKNWGMHQMGVCVKSAIYSIRFYQMSYSFSPLQALNIGVISILDEFPKLKKQDKEYINLVSVDVFTCSIRNQAIT